MKLIRFFYGVYDALCHHSLGYLHNACDVRSLYIVYIAVFFSTILHAVFVDVFHNVVQLAIYFFCTP